MMEWISVKDESGDVILDKLPEKKRVVLVIYGSGEIKTNSYGSGMYDDIFTREDGTVDVIWEGNTIGVTHWMPLPKPPTT